MRVFAAGVAFSLLATACGGGDDAGARPKTIEVTPAPEGEPWPTLEQWHLFANAAEQDPAARVEPYQVASPLWSDGTFKRRFVHLPAGATIGYEPEAVWKFPVGTILVKTFSYLTDARDPSLGERLLETRLLIHESNGWVPETYVWDEQQATAKRTVAGAEIPVTFIDAAGASHDVSYGVPNTNMCHECHGTGAKLDSLGGRTRQLNRDQDYSKGSENQIDHLTALGWLDVAPPPAAERETLQSPVGSAAVGDRARSYLDANCGHCHAEGRAASSSGLWLDWKNTGSGASSSYGICKTPTSAGGGTCGLVHDIVPGKPDESVLICRVASREPKVQMPPLATQLVDDTGVSLLRDWIGSLTDPPCK